MIYSEQLVGTCKHFFINYFKENTNKINQIFSKKNPVKTRLKFRLRSILGNFWQVDTIFHKLFYKINQMFLGKDDVKTRLKCRQNFRRVLTPTTTTTITYSVLSNFWQVNTIFHKL